MEYWERCGDVEPGKFAKVTAETVVEENGIEIEGATQIHKEVKRTKEIWLNLVACKRSLLM